jgi:WhiB family transcriptional regulator, redox-sensing transcriptional regulator
MIFDDPGAACVGVDVTVFYELTPVNKEMALALCRACPARAACLEYVMTWETGVAKFGIWGGLTPKERGRLVKERSRKAKAKAA